MYRFIRHRFDEIQDHLHKDFKTDFFFGLNFLRESMAKAYFEREIFGHLDIAESYSNIQVTFAQVLRGLQGHPGPWRDVCLET